jgi:lariat debranching enzyme
MRRKRFLADEIAAGTLGSMPTEELLYLLKPAYWFSAHLHVKFAALINHGVSEFLFLVLLKTRFQILMHVL